MSARILVFYGSYRSDRLGIRLAHFVVERLRRRGCEVELIDAKAVNLPMLDRMYKEYPKGNAPPALEELAGKIRKADGFVFVTGEYNWGMQPGLKNLTDHFLEEWFWRPAAIVSYSAGRSVRRACRHRLARHAVRDGHDRDLEHDRGRPDRRNAVGRGRADGRRRRGRRARVPAFRERFDVVDRGGAGTAQAQTAAVLSEIETRFSYPPLCGEGRRE